MGAATAGKGLGFHPALYPYDTHQQGAAQWAAPLSLARVAGACALPASKTYCGPRAERADDPFKGIIPLNTNYAFKGNVKWQVTPLNACIPLNDPKSLRAVSLNLSLHAQLVTVRAFEHSSFLITRVNQEGGFCNTPLYIYLNALERI